MSNYKKTQILFALEGHNPEYNPTMKVTGTANSSKFLDITPEAVRTIAGMIDDDGNVTPNIEAISTEHLKKELERRGFYTRDLFSVDDVRARLDELNEDNHTGFELSDSECFEVLDSVFSNVQAINESIYEELEEKLTPNE